MMIFKDGWEFWKVVKNGESLEIVKVDGFWATGEFNESFK